MATTIVKNETVDSEAWELTETASATQEYIKKIKIGGKYIDRDIKLKIKSKSGSANINAKTVDSLTPTINVPRETGEIEVVIDTNSFDVTGACTAGWISSIAKALVTVNGKTVRQQLPLVKPSGDIDGQVTIVPGGEDLVIEGSSSTDANLESGFWVNKPIVILGDANLLAENIKKGVKIFGVTGTFKGNPSGENSDTPDGTASQLLEGFELWDANGNSVTGVMVNWSNKNITSSATTGKKLSFTLNGSVYKIRMYMGNTGYVVADSTYIEDSVAAGSISKGTTSAGTKNSELTSSGTTDQYVNVAAGYYSSAQHVKINKMAKGSATVTQQATAEADFEKSSAIQALVSIDGLVENTSYVKVVAKAKATSGASKSTVAGYITNNEVDLGSAATDNDTETLYIKMYNGEIE